MEIDFSFSFFFSEAFGGSYLRNTVEASNGGGKSNVNSY
jgi:hypothetical protein